MSAEAQTSKSVSRSVQQIGPSGDLRLVDGELQLSLDEAVAMALQRNLALNVERYRQRESGFTVQTAEGIYDYNLTVDLTAFEETSPTATSLDAGAGATVNEQENRGWNLGLNRLIPTGGRAQIDFRNSRFESNSLFSTLNPRYRSDFDLTFSQPLLRDKGRDSTERNIRVARNNLDISRENFELQVIRTVQQVVDSYFTLVGAREQFKVAEESLALAQQLHEQNRVRVDVGTLAPLEMVQSEAGVATREEEIIRARGAIGDAEDRLRQLLNLDGEGLWSTPILPTTDPESAPVEIDLDEAIAMALERRAELRSKRLAQKNLEIDTGYFRNQKLPRLDLAVTYGVNGLGGPQTLRNFFTGEILAQAPGGYSDALSQLERGDFDGWNVALNLIYPLENTAGKAQMALAEVAFDRGAAELRDLELGVITEVRRLARAVETAAQARSSAGVSRRLAEENLDAEQKRYENGMSTSFQVLEIQEDLTQARSREVNAITAYRQALALFYQATGELIERAGIELVDGGE